MDSEENNWLLELPDKDAAEYVKLDEPLLRSELSVVLASLVELLLDSCDGPRLHPTSKNDVTRQNEKNFFKDKPPFVINYSTKQFYCNRLQIICHFYQKCIFVELKHSSFEQYLCIIK